MTCNYSATRESKTWCSLGFLGYEQDRQRGSCTTTASDEGRSAVVTRNAAGRGCSQGRGHTYDSERVESASDGGGGGGGGGGGRAGGRGGGWGGGGRRG